MLRKKSKEELGFNPNIVTAVGCATPPCVSKELAESCSDFVCNVIMQDDIVPRLSLASLTRLRNEIIETNWTSVEKGDWRRVVDLVTNAKQVVSSAQDVARNLAEFAKFRTNKEIFGGSLRKLNSDEIIATVSHVSLQMIVPKAATSIPRNSHDNTPASPKNPASPVELLVLDYLRREMADDAGSINSIKGNKSCTLWKRQPGDHFQWIVLTNNLISDHKCDALRDVIKSLPASTENVRFAP